MVVTDSSKRIIPPITPVFDLGIYSPKDSTDSIELRKKPDGELEPILATLIQESLDEWGKPTHMKAKHGEYAREALEVMREQLTAPFKPHYSPILTIEGNKFKEKAALLSVKRPYQRQTDAPLFAIIGSYLNNSSNKERTLFSLVRKNNDLQEKLMFCIAASIANLDPFSVITFSQQESTAAHIFLKTLFMSARLNRRFDEINYKKDLKVASEKSGIGATNKIVRLVQAPWKVTPRVFFEYDPDSHKVGKKIMTAFLRFDGLTKGIPEKGMRTMIYSE